MAVVTIKNYIDVMDGNVNNGLLYKLYTSATTPIGVFDIVGANGELAFGKTGELNEAKFLVIGAGTYGATGGKADALAVTSLVEVELSAALTVGTKLYLANSEEGTAGKLVTTLTSTSGDEAQAIGYVVNDQAAGSTSKIALLDFKKDSVSI